MKRSPDIKAGLIKEAQEWERALLSGSPAVNAEFAAWIRRSPEHLQAYLQCLSLEKELGNLDGSRHLDLDKLRGELSGNVVPLALEKLPPTEEPRIRPPAYRVSRPTLALAACAVVGLCLALWHARHDREWVEYTTATGEQRRVVLPDGSIVELNTGSKIRVSYIRAARELELVSGEAAFTVQHDASRPFRVHAGASWLEDVATEFSVYLQNNSRTTVSVLSGRIGVSPDRDHRQSMGTEGTVPSLKQTTQEVTLVSEGEQVELDHSGRVVSLGRMNVTEMAGWRQHRVWFDGASLADVAREFNRYNMKKIEVESSPATLQKHYSATWDPYDPASFIDYLRLDPALSIKSEGDLTVVRAR